jgi:hypothetical protein
MNTDPLKEKPITRGRFLGIGLVLSVIGIVVYLPSLVNHFSSDSVYFFGGLCESLEKDLLRQWIFRFENGHLSVIPSIGY